MWSCRSRCSSGLLLISVGIWRERRRRKRGMPASTLLFTLDLNSSRAAHGAHDLFATATVIFLLFTAYGSYRVFEWTESVTFCGTICHKVMEPEYTAYQNSPHARVKCVDCHVGSGAGWYVRSKLSGAYQVYAVLANVYPRPIPTPIKNLRPAQETCEQCHWPSISPGEKEVVNTYFKSDEQNTRWTIALLHEDRRRQSATEEPAGGIHWHMNIANEITYAATDTLRQTIPWVRMHNRFTGETREFTVRDAPIDEGRPRSPAEKPDGLHRLPQPAVAHLPPTRPHRRPEPRTGPYQPVPSGHPRHRREPPGNPLRQRRGRRRQHPAPAECRLCGKAGRDPRQPAAAARRRRGGAERPVPPEFLPVHERLWKAYPNNIGHMTDLGCFRCHDGNHVSADGKVISKDCNTCHTILYQGSAPEPTTLTPSGLTFQHPEDVGDAWLTTNCKECHSGQ